MFLRMTRIYSGRKEGEGHWERIIHMMAQQLNRMKDHRGEGMLVLDVDMVSVPGT